jgi:hypothetical protein
MPAPALVTVGDDISSSQSLATGQLEALPADTALDNELSWNPNVSYSFGNEGVASGEAYMDQERVIPMEQQYGSDYSMSISVDDQGSVPWITYDASGGFNPDIASWTWYDTIGHPDSW